MNCPCTCMHMHACMHDACDGGCDGHACVAHMHACMHACTMHAMVDVMGMRAWRTCMHAHRTKYTHTVRMYVHACKPYVCTCIQAVCTCIHRYIHTSTYTCECASQASIHLCIEQIILLQAANAIENMIRALEIQ
jgi:hypothetical protein